MTTAQAIDRPLCGAEKGNGKTCGLVAGWGTDHKGVGRCRKHLGNTRNHRSAADTQLAIKFAKDALGLEIEIDPLAGMLLSVRLAAGQVIYWQLRLQESRDDEVKTDRLQQGYDEALKNLNRFTKAALDAGVDAKRVAVAERMAEIISLAAEDALAKLSLTPKQRREFAVAFSAALGHHEQAVLEAEQIAP